MAKIVWAETALKDLEGIYDYIARDSQLFARHQIEEIFKAVERLVQFPKSGHRLPEFPDLPYREILVKNYRVVYRFDDELNQIIIISIIHSSRLLKRIENT